MEYMATFYNHTQAISFAQKMKQNGIRTAMMPLPRSLSANCGTAVRFWTEEDPLAVSRGSTVQAIYLITSRGYERVTN